MSGYLAILLFVCISAIGKCQEPSLAQINQPFAVAIKVNNAYTCNGAIISPNRILTAANCVYNYVNKTALYKDLTVFAGSPSLSGNGSIYHINSIVVHHNYTHGKFAHNLAVLNLTTEIVESDTQKVIELADEIALNNSSSAITGWGSQSQGTTVDDKLHAFEKIIVTAAECNAQYFGGDNTIVDANDLCGITNDTAGYCVNHGGGLLIFDEVLIGIVSWGMSNCMLISNNIDVYTSTYTHKDFLENAIK